MKILIKRAYAEALPEDGYRVLVDRLWPRGVKKDDLRLDLWAKEIAPSTELRKWFGHDPKRWEEFCSRYKEELKSPEARLRLSGSFVRRVARALASLPLPPGGGVSLKGFFPSR
jgi:uncharacterized protein YeaO (DUF488 family)